MISRASFRLDTAGSHWGRFARTVCPIKVTQTEVVATGKFGEAVVLNIVPHRLLQLALVVGIIAGRGGAHAAQNTQGEADTQGIGVARQGGYINGL